MSSNYYDEINNTFNYPVSCDKCTFNPGKYCEICMIRSDLRSAINENRKMVQSQCAHMQIELNSLKEIHLFYHKEWITLWRTETRDSSFADKIEST